MSINKHYYIGPYVSAKIECLEIDRCEKHDFGLGNYCSTCGASKLNRNYKTIIYKVPQYWQEEYHKGLFCNYLCNTSSINTPPIIDGFRTYYYFPNRNYEELGIPRINDDRETEILDFKEMNMVEMTDKFKIIFKEEIDYMSQWFQTEIHFGLLGYYN